MRETRYRCDAFAIDVANRRFLSSGREMPVEPRVFAVIAQLLARHGDLVTRNELLDAVWGHRYVTPSTLNRTIALARRAFGDDADDPRYILTVHGAGYRFVGALSHDESEDPTPTARFGPPPIVRLPARIDTLIGRDETLRLLADLLARHRAVTVVGAGGMGKTQCALETAREIAGDYPDGVWFFDLAPIARAEDWLHAFGAALVLPSGSPDELVGRIGEYLHNRRMLLLLDNCDRIAADVGVLLVALLRTTSALRVLATAQTPLNFSGEQLLHLPPLGVPSRPAVGPETVEGALACAAVQMLIARIGAIRADFELTAENVGAVAEICRRLDGMPLALELAAARFALLSAEQVLERLDHRFRFLGSSSAGRDPRHRNLVDLLDWSYGHLSAREQRLLNWCAVFVQSWTVDAALRLAADQDCDAETAVDLLGGLANRSLLSPVPAAAPPRYRLLETVRDYSLERLAASGELAAARAAHLRIYSELCTRAFHDMLAGRMRERIDQLLQERGNIAAALETGIGTPDGRRRALEIVGSLVLFGKAHGLYQTVSHWCERVLAECPPDDSLAGARALLTLGVARVHLSGRYSWDPRAFADAVRIAAAHADWWTEAYAQGYWALGLAAFGRANEAEPHARAVRELAERHDDALMRGLSGLARGWIDLAAGHPSAALAAFQSAQGLGPDLHQHHFVLMYIGLSQFALGEHSAAAHSWLQAMRLSLAVGNIRGVAGSIEGAAYLACRDGRFLEAARLLTAAQRIRERTECPLFVFWLPHQRAAEAAIREHLPAPDRAGAQRDGTLLPEEVAANEAQTLLAAAAAAT